MWNVPVRFLVMWSPIVAVSIGGGIYIYECAQTLLSPGTGFTIDYPTKSDSLKITCKTYNIDLLQQTVIIDQLVIRKKDGSLLARVPHFVATGITVVQGITPKIQLKDAELWVKRDTKGDLDILNLFESSQNTDSQQPWQVSIRDSVIHFTDQTVNGGVKDEIKVDSGNFVGIGENAEGSAALEISGLAKGQIGFKKGSRKTSIYGTKITGKLEPVLARLRSGHEKTFIKSIDSLKIGGGTASCDFIVTLSSAPFQFLANFSASATKVAWDSYSADLMDLSGTVSEEGFVGKAKIQDKQAKGELEGNLSYAKETVFGGNLSVSGVNPGYLDSFKLKLPKDFSFKTASSKGHLTYEKGRFGWKGQSSFNSATVYGLKIPNLNGDVSYQGDQLVASIRPTQVGETMIEGTFGVNLKSRAILGSFSTPQLNGKDLSRWLPTNVLQSTARLVGIVDGTLSKPNILVKGSLEPKIKLADRTLSYGSADVILRFDGKVFSLDRLAMMDDSGSLFASGSIDLKKGLNVRVVGNNFDLSKLTSTTTGKLDVQGLLTGSLSNPQYSGKLQGYQIGYSGISGKVVALATDFSGNNKGINFLEIDAMKGASQITGSLGLGFTDQKLLGLFAVDGIEISDLDQGEVGGILNLREISVAGTFDKPMVAGLFDAKKILANDFAADSAQGKISFDGERFRIFETNAVFANGTVSDLSGDYDAKTKTGKVVGQFQKLDLSDVEQTIKQKAKKSQNEDLFGQLSQLAIKGSSTGSFEVGVKNGKFANLSGKGRVDDVFLNKATIGSGDWDVAYDGKTWSGNAFIGTLAEYFRLDGFTYSPTTTEVSGEFLSYQIPLKELIVAVQPSLNLSDDFVKKMELVNGQLSSFAKFSGSTTNPTIDVPDFEISEIKLGGVGDGKVEDIGSFSMKANLNNKEFTISDGILVGPKISKITVPFAGTINVPSNLSIPDGTAKLSGTIKDLTALTYDLKGSIFGFPVSKFAPVAPALANYDVFINRANFKLTGNVSEPLLESSFKMSAGLTPERKRASSGLASRLKIEGDIAAKPGLKLGEEGASLVTGQGKFQFDSLAGTLGLSFLTNSSITGIDQNAPFLFTAKLDGERDVTEFIKQAGGIVIGEKGAQLSGEIEVNNTLKDKKFKGGFDLKADSIRSTSVEPIIGKPLDAILKDLTLSAKFENNSSGDSVLRTKLSAATNYSKLDPKNPDLGTVKFDAKVLLDDFFAVKEPGTAWANVGIRDGSLAFSNLGLYQSFAQNTFAQGSVFTEPGKPVVVSGTLSKPKLSGSVFFDEVRTVIPTLLPPNGTTTSATIEPVFDIKFFANNPINIKSSLISIDAKGIGSIKGTLSNLKAEGVMTVENGDLLLPGGKVKLTPDGTITLKHDSSLSGKQTKMLAKLEGKTSSTILRNGVTPERLEIELTITGDLLASDADELIIKEDKNEQFTSRDKGLSFSARSQYGPLNQEEIYRLLGRTDILQSLLQTGVNSNIESEIRNTGFGFILPSVFNRLTTDIAKGFKLDYVGVDYNAFEQASVSFVKNVGSGFFIQGRQQLIQPLPGKLTAYDFRLVYRPRRGANSIRALSFSLGTDQLRPYKLSIEFNTKVRTRKPPYQTLKLDVPNR